MQVSKPFQSYEPPPPQLKPADPVTILVADAAIGIILEELTEVWIEHIGSTAVPGLAGSGIIDLMLISSPDQIEPVQKALDRLGFQQPHPNDPLSSTPLVRVASMPYEGKSYLIHLYIVDKDSPRVNQFRTFRDRLRLDPAFRSAYQDLKRSFFARGSLSPSEYTRVKSEFIQRALS
ncbi:MAG: hypothetical protein KatS3mg046_269 [Bellilinea sp.]|nr:MAG: hypothetical protein KatS3mg046_269 [Bellilinea sp.]